MQPLKKDILLLLVWPILASLISILIKANIFTSLLLFLAIPSIYLSIRNKNLIKKSALFALMLSIPIGIIVDYIMEMTGGWFLPFSVFGSFRLFTYVTLEQLIWLFFYLYFVLMFYETFLEKECACRPYLPKFKFLVIFIYILLGLFVAAYYLKPDILNIHYFYLKFGLIFAIIPVILVLLKSPTIYTKLFRAGAYFFYLSFLYEITALALNQWSFPVENHFIGYVEFFRLKFPYEEFIFWIILGAISTLAYYELFDDDMK